MGRIQGLSKTPKWLTNCIFKGGEAEIPDLKGRKTLFVAKKDYNYKDVAERLIAHNFYVLYAGAGNVNPRTQLTKNLFKTVFRNQLLAKTYVFETSNYTQALNFAKWALTINDKKTDMWLVEKLYIVLRVEGKTSNIDWKDLEELSKDIFIFLKIPTKNAAILIDIHDYDEVTYFDDPLYQSDKIIEDL